MRIAFIYDVIYPFVKGGAEKRNWEIAKRLSARGHEVHLFGMKSWDGPPDIVSEGVYLHGICNFRNLYLKEGRRDLGEVLYFSRHLLPALWKLKFDIIDCNAFPYLPFFLVKIISRLKNTALVVTWQEVWGSYWYSYLGYLRGFFARVIERLVIKLSDNIIVHSLTTKRELTRCGFKEENIKIIPHGIDLKITGDTPAALDETDLIFAGRLIRDKNADILIKSVLSVKKSFNAIKCIIIGEGPEKEKLVGLADRLNLKDNVIFKDFLGYKELIAHMKASKIFVFPSVREGFGIVVIEAMACGLPVITVRHPMNAAAELVEDGKSGFICQPGEEGIALKIKVLLKDYNLRNNMASRAKEIARGYGWDRIAEGNEAFYRLAINRHSAQE